MENYEPSEGLDKPWKALARGEDKGTSPGATAECTDSTFPPLRDLGEELDDDSTVPTGENSTVDHFPLVTALLSAPLGCRIFGVSVGVSMVACLTRGDFLSPDCYRGSESRC